MTDARIPERYLMDRRVVRLTHAQRSSYFMSTLWSVSNRTDGHFDREDLPFIPTFDTDAVNALVKVGLWNVTETGWVDVEFLSVQTSRDDLVVLDNARKADREKKARLKAHKVGQHHLCTSSTCEEVERQSPSFTPAPSDVPGERSRGAHRIGEDRQGKDRRGRNENQDSQEEVSPNTSTTKSGPFVGSPLEYIEEDWYEPAPALNLSTSAYAAPPEPEPVAEAGVKVVKLAADPGYCRKHGGPWPCKKSSAVCEWSK